MFKTINIVIVVIVLVSTGCKNSESKSEFNSTAFSEPPQWSKEAVWYQIFVDRFRNGDPNNDPRPEDIKGAYPGYAPEGWTVTPWTQDWYKDDAYIKNITPKTYHPDTLENFNQKSQLRRYGGDLQGVLDQLDYLDSLGITAAYFNPLNDAPSLHKFDARYWRHIDRNFGPNPKKDVKTMEAENPTDPSTWKFTEADLLFLKLIKEFHKRGIKIILDYSWNHTGIEFWAWKDVLEKQEQSAYKDWYWIKSFDDPNTEKNEFEYKGWMGVPSLPEIKETQHQNMDEGLQSFKGDVYSKQVKEHIFNVTKRWLDPNNDGDTSDGIDGFRLDVAAEMPTDFWEHFRREVRKINPEAYLVGEVWWDTWPNKLADPKDFLNGKIFDAVMNYRWYRNARQFFGSSPTPIAASGFVDSLHHQLSTIRKANTYAMMNTAASHDSPRVLTSLYNKNQYKFHSSPEGNTNYKINKPDAKTYETLTLLLIHQFTYIGAPHIWAGDEMGMWGADDPSNRKPLIWPDYDFEPEAYLADGTIRAKSDQIHFNNELFSLYKRLIQIRKENPVLSYGELEFTFLDDANGILTYSRFDETSEVLVLFNVGEERKKVVVSKKFQKKYTSLCKENTILSQSNDSITVHLLPRSAAIFNTH